MRAIIPSFRVPVPITKAGLRLRTYPFASVYRKSYAMKAGERTTHEERTANEHRRPMLHKYMITEIRQVLPDVRLLKLRSTSKPDCIEASFPKILCIFQLKH